MLLYSHVDGMDEVLFGRGCLREEVMRIDSSQAER